MEPRIQYAQTEDGVSIAYWALGEGMPLVQMPSTAFNPTYRSWQTLEGRQWYERLAEKRRVIRYDSRGFGHSQHGVTTSSLDTMVLDLEATVDRLGLEQVVLFGYLYSGPVAIAYAIRHPERVSHLILWCSSARGADFFASDRGDILTELRAKDWEFYTETLAFAVFGWAGGEQARRYAALLRETATPEAVQAAVDATLALDVSELLPDVRTPTLVLHRRGCDLPNVDIAGGLAARIPDAQLTVLEGDSPIPYLDDMEPVLRAIDEFLSEGDEESFKSAPSAPSGLVTILFTDMESSTTLRRKLGDAKVQELLRTHNEIVRTALDEHAGNEIKHTGDGIMASFSTATSALRCSIDIQRGVARHAEEHPAAPLGVYVGLNAGEPIAESDPDGRVDLFGTSVDLARRICDHAEPGQILASNVVRELAEGKGFLFGDIGDVVPKGFEQPVRLYEVRWREDG